MAQIEDYGPTILETNWSQVGLSAFFLSLRLYCKFKKRSGLWWDDHILIASWICLLISVILMSLSVSLGFGKHIEQVDPLNLSQITINNNILTSTTILAAVWSKTSFAMTLLRLQDKGFMRIFIWTAIISMNVLMGFNALIVWLQCAPIEKFWNPDTPGSCWDPRVTTYFDIAASAYSALMDIMLAMLPWKIIWGLQMKIQEKIGVGIAMSMGLFAGSTALIKCSVLPTLASEADWTYEIGQLAIWGIVEPGVTITAASIPVLRVLIRDVVTATQKYYNSSGFGSFKSRVGHEGSTRQNNTVTVTTSSQKSPPGRKWCKLADERSEKSIDSGQIVRTKEVVVEYDTRHDIEGGNGVYELHQMGPKNPGNMI
ncbi:hypothetical protein LZ32DRAFT_560233 [Colletotrichum eremochloae]|nr:hypothetical protein LZ32DRAFT_560233 [Colletotrichum eremochloae]